MPPVTCPTCQRATEWHGNAHRPFCSLSCRLIDLGVWLDERYRIPAEPRDGEFPAPRSAAASDAEGERVS
jgi:endogenous inhibitor of DNA gyrase (YacG/DUF329 family)